MVRASETFLDEITVLAKDGSTTVDASLARIVNASNPIDSQDLATKDYVDSAGSDGYISLEDESVPVSANINTLNFLGNVVSLAGVGTTGNITIDPSLSEVLVNGNSTGGTSINFTSGDNVTMAGNFSMTSAAGTGASITLTSGSNTTGSGGDISLTAAGSTNPGSASGRVILSTASDFGGGAGTGDINAFTGDCNSGITGAMNFSTGAAFTTATASGGVQLKSGDHFSATATNSGFITIRSGNLSHAANAGDTGSVAISSGNNSSTNAAADSGAVGLGSGSTNAAGGISGETSLTSGHGRSSGRVYISSGDSLSTTGDSGDLVLKTGAGGNTNPGTSGDVDISTTGAYSSGDISLTCGASTGASGGISITGGTSSTLAGGGITITAGSASAGAGGDLSLYAGNSGGLNIGGDILLKIGLSGAGNGHVKIGIDPTLGANNSLFQSYGDGYFDGDLEVSGKLTVGGLIDPTGLVLDVQPTVPGGTPGAGKSTLWVRDSDGYVVITDEFGGDVVLSGGGSLAQTLALGNSTEGNNLNISVDDKLVILGPDGYISLFRDAESGYDNQFYIAGAGNSTGNVNGAGESISIRSGIGFSTAAGSVLNLFSGDFDNLVNDGGSCDLTGGYGIFTGAGGTVSINGGQGGDTGNGGDARVLAGNGGSTSGNGGNIILTAGTPTLGGGGSVTITAGDGPNAAGDITISCGDALAGNIFGGQCTINAGDGTGVRDGGDVSLAGGAATGSGQGGDIHFNGGTTVSGALAGSINLTAGSTAGAGNGGNVNINAGSGTANGNVNITGANILLTGDAEVTGKLTVGGLIDPTGLVLDVQPTVPGGMPAAGKSTLWVRDSDGYIIVTDDVGNDIVISGDLQTPAIGNYLGQQNLLDFPEADPTGVADSRAAIVSAIESALGINPGDLDDPTKGDAAYVNATRPASYIYFPPGNYRITSTITIRYMGVSLVGVPSATQGGTQGNGSLITCDFDGTGFRLYTGAAAEWDGARDLSFSGITIKRAAGHTGSAVAVGGDTWTSGLAFDGCRITGHTIGIEIEATYNNPAFARLALRNSIIDNCGDGIETNGKHLSNADIQWSRITQCSTEGFSGGLTGSRIGQLNCEGTPSPMTIDGTNSYAFTIGPLYFEDHDTGLACLDIRLARDFTLDGIQTSGTVSIPLVRVQTAADGRLPGRDVVCVGATDCTFRSMLVPAFGHADNEFAAAWIMSHRTAGLPLLPRLPWTCQGIQNVSVYTEAANFGSSTLKAVRIGTSGVPESRLNALTFTPTTTLNVGDVALVAWAVKYDAGRGGLSSAANVTVAARRTSDATYEDVGSFNIDHITDVGEGDVVQFITAWRIVDDIDHTPPYNAFRVTIYPYGTDVGDTHYDGFISPILYAELDGYADLMIPPFDVPTLLKNTIGETRLDPAQLTASVNNYAPGIIPGVNTVYVDGDAPWSITGFAAVVGASFRIINDGATHAITLEHNDAGSSAGNKILCATGADIVLAAGGMATVSYDTTAAAWRAQ